jgi:hypothetical protein
MNKLKRPKDVNSLAKTVVDIATGEKTEPMPTPVNVMTIQDVARLGGLKGGKARAKKLSKADRVKIAKAGAKARWRKHPRAA